MLVYYRVGDAIGQVPAEEMVDDGLGNLFAFLFAATIDSFYDSPRGGQLAVLPKVGEEEFLDKTAGSPIRRIGYERWLRNLAVGLGNAPWSDAVEAALWARRAYPSDLVREHVAWALAEQRRKRDARIATRA